MPDIYISRAGMENKDLDVKFTNTELSGLKDDLAKLQQQTHLKDERIATLQRTIDGMQHNLSAITELLCRNPSVAEVERALKRKRPKSQV